MSFLDDLDEETALAPPAPRKPLTSEEKQLEGLRKVEDRILTKSMSIIEDIDGAADIDDGHDPEVHGIPDEWIKEVGLVAAAKRLRVAKDARRNKKEAPVYLEHARATALGIIKSRAQQPIAVQSLNVAFIVAAPPKAKQAYPVIDIDPEEDTGEK